MNRDFLCKRTEKIKDMVFGTIDLETLPFGEKMKNAEKIAPGSSFRGAGLYDGNSEDRVEFFTSTHDLIQSLLHRDVTRWFFHNGAHFDFAFLRSALVELIDQGYEIIPLARGEADFITYTISKDGEKIFTLEDSFTTVPVSLRDFANSFSPPAYQKKDVGIAKGLIWDINDPRHREYLRYDCLSLYHAIKGYERVLHEHFEVNWHVTSGSVARAVFRRLIPENHIYSHARPEEATFLRKAYTGGLVHLGWSTENRGETVTGDIHAAYAGIGMKGQFSIRKGVYTRRYIKNIFGVYHVVMHIPRKTPVVPFMQYVETGRVYATGEKCHVYETSEMLEFAKNELGCTWEVVEGYIYPQTEEVFNAFSGKMEWLEDNYAEAKDAAKNNRNSLYGSFAIRSDMKKYILMKEPKGDWTPLHSDKGLVPNVFFSEEENTPDYAMVVWAVTITSRVRIYLSRVILWCHQHGYDCYSDTDSIIVSPECWQRLQSEGIITIGSKYGTWAVDKFVPIDEEGNALVDESGKRVKVEARFSDFYVIAPKNYIGRTKELHIKRRSKGVSYGIAIDSEGKPQLTGKEHFAYVETRMGLEEPILKDVPSVRHGKTLWTKQDGGIIDHFNKKVSLELNSSSWLVKDGSFTHPHYIEGKLVE